MGVDVFGYDNAVSQINSLKTSDFELQQGVQDWNNTVQQQYNKDKSGEGLQNDASYVKDLVGNVMGANGLNSAISNRKSRLMTDAKNKLAEILPEKYSAGFKPPEDPEDEPDNPVDTPADATAPATATPLTQDADDTGNALNDMMDEGGGQGGDARARFLQESEDADPRGQVLSGGGGTGNALSGYRNGGTADMEDELVQKFKDAGGDIDKIKDEEDTLLGKTLSKVSGGRLGQGDAELLGKVGGAITNGSVGGMDLVDGINNLAHGQSFFGKGSTGLGDVDKTLQMVAGASDIVGLIPGLEWVAGIGNVAGLAGSVVGAFGDHQGNIQRDQNVTDELNQRKVMPGAVDEGGEIAGVSQSTARVN
jgi:hypothetical protein